MRRPEGRHVNPRGENQRHRLLFHVHTRRSFDSNLTPQQIVDFARRHKFDAVIVTDHNTHLGSWDCAQVAGDDGPRFPLAAEYKSTSGDMIAVFIFRPIAARDPIGIIDETHAQGGLVILPHPFRYSRFSREVFERCDLIETFNARTSDDDNRRAADLARELQKPALAGPDAHLHGELKLAINEYHVPGDWDWKRTLLEGQARTRTAKTTVCSVRTSQMIHACRRGKPILLAKSAIRWIMTPGTRTVP